MTRFLLNPKLTPEERFTVLKTANEIVERQQDLVLSGVPIHQFKTVEKDAEGKEHSVSL